MSAKPETMTVKTKDRIVHAALELFNTHGERKITTNHIAAHLKISPGNLYYHYRNKSDIIARIFDQYEQALAVLFDLPQDRSITLEDQTKLMGKLLQVFWNYRFLHRDLVGMLANDAELHQRYQKIAETGIAQAGNIIRRLRDADIMQISEEEIAPLALNIWLVLTGWGSYLRTARGIAEEDIRQEHLFEVLKQLISLELPYLSPETRTLIQQTLNQLQPSS